MQIRFNQSRVILYLSITVVFLIHWIYNDLKSHPDDLGIILLSNFWEVIYVVGLNILYFDYALPFATSGKISRAVAIVSSVITFIVVFALGLYCWRSLGILTGIYNPFRSYSDAGEALASAFRFTPGVFLLFAVFRLFFEYTQLKYEAQKVRLEKKQAELLFLKSQINPHFLFNTLNNIYSLSQHQPQLVPESVLRLSKILRYLLHETGNELVTIEKEIRILTDYIDLERLRYSDSVTINFGHEITDASAMIPPLLLLPLVENAFKHGVSTSRGKRFVEVKCVVQQRNLHFMVKNSSHDSPDYNETKDSIGLSNLRRRLELLYGRFELITGQKDSMFTAELKIDLASHV